MRLSLRPCGPHPGNTSVKISPLIAINHLIFSGITTPTILYIGLYTKEQDMGEESKPLIAMPLDKRHSYHGRSPLSWCLTALICIPTVWVLYMVARDAAHTALGMIRGNHLPQDPNAAADIILSSSPIIDGHIGKHQYLMSSLLRWGSEFDRLAHPREGTVRQ